MSIFQRLFFFFLCLEMFKYTADLGKVYWLKLGDEVVVRQRNTS